MKSSLHLYEANASSLAFKLDWNNAEKSFLIFFRPSLIDRSFERT